MITRFLNSQTKTITFAAILLSISALISRILGLLRDRLLAGQFGAGPELDIYFAAFRIPDFVYGILIMGGISAVFLPVFSEAFSKNKEEAWELVNNILNCFLILLVLICGILVIFAPWVVKFIAPGFNPEQKELAVSLTRIMFLSPIFFGISSVFSGILHYFNRFLVYSIAPILYNLSIIFGILYFYPIFGLVGLIYGVVLGAFLHWLIQIPAARNSGFRYLAVLNFRHPGLLKLFKLMIPRSMGAAVYQLNVIVMTAIASTLAAGSISILAFSDNLQSLPLGIIGASFALASFPVLSRAWANGQKEEFIKHFSETFRLILFLIIPISVGFFLLRFQLVKLILATGQFGFNETKLTAASLGLFCLAIFSQSFIPFLARSFFSFQDTKTPLFIGLFSMFLNISLSLLFVKILSFSGSFQESLINFLNLQGIKNSAVIGLPLALSISSTVQFFLFLLFLRKKFDGLKIKGVENSFKKIVLASFLMALTIYFVLKLTTNFLDLNNFGELFFQTTLAGFSGALIYILIVILLKSSELKTIKSSILKQFSK